MLPIAPVGLVYAPAKIFVGGDPAATADNVRHFGGLLHAAMACDLAHQLICVFLIIALYKLFRPVNEFLAKQVVIFGALLSVPIMFINVLNDVAAEFLANQPLYQNAFDTDQINALIYLFMQLHGQGIVVASIFWGIWLIPFGMLVIRCGFIPKIFGYLLFLAGAGYIVNSFTSLVLPEYASIVSPIAGATNIAEVPIIFWLAFWGARTNSKVPA